MTTVLIDSNSRTIVADKQTTYTYPYIEGAVSRGDTKKIHPLPDSRYFVGSGDVVELDRQLDRCQTGLTLDDPKVGDVTICIVVRKGNGLLIDVYKPKKCKKFLIFNSFKWERTTVQGEGKYVSFGSGGSFAAGAFVAGLSAEESVKVASKCCEFTSFEVDVVEVL